MDIFSLAQRFVQVEQIFPENNKRKNYFLAACLSLDSKVSLQDINTNVPFGGIIGIDNSKLDYFLNRFKIFRLHAVLHDASGYMKSKYNIGPGYCYFFKNFPFNSCYLGHFTGLLYCFVLKVGTTYYSLLDC